MAPTTTTVRSILADLERRGSKKNRDGMAGYGIVAKKSFGISVSDLRAAAMRTAEALARSDAASARRIGREALRDLGRPSRSSNK